MKKLCILTLILTSCATAPVFYSAPEDSSRNTDSKYTQDIISKQIDSTELDQNLSRFYVGPQSAHVSALPLTGAVIDSIGFIKTSKDDYNKYEYRDVANQYKAFLFNKVSCFFVFIKGNGVLSDLKKYEVQIGNVGGAEHTAVIKSEQEHLNTILMLNQMFPKTYSQGKARSLETDIQYSQELVCGDKIDFSKPFFIRFKANAEGQTTIELYWL